MESVWYGISLMISLKYHGASVLLLMKWIRMAASDPKQVLLCSNRHKLSPRLFLKVVVIPHHCVIGAPELVVYFPRLVILLGKVSIPRSGGIFPRLGKLDHLDDEHLHNTF
ncbi:hypothetical protein C5167_024839 [Papaver somniferum]|uniref:Uncharacterized protein n=1 Tax=Papaver somniferum TaxID=3469 RepID=A0A4Y7JSS1_PAPSO|nr:hypothetical protein C5167_024839 [Papaver somniferum]